MLFRKLRKCSALVGMAMAAVLLTSTEASAATYDGWRAGDVPGCTANSKRIGEAMSVYDAAGAYYGWAEWRYGQGGSCWDYQWVRLHVTSAIGAYSGGDPGTWTHLRVTRYGAQVGDVNFGSWVAVGDYDGTVTYAPNDQLCATIEGLDANRASLFFGHSGQPYTWCA